MEAREKRKWNDSKQKTHHLWHSSSKRHSTFTCFHQVAEDSRLADLQNSGFSIHGTHQVDPPSPLEHHLVLSSKMLDLDIAPGSVADTEQCPCPFGFEVNLPKGAMHSGLEDKKVQLT